MIWLGWEARGLMEKLKNIRAKGLKYAANMAVQWTAKDARVAVQAEIDEKVDRPTPLTKRAARTMPVPESKGAEAWVYIQDEASKGTPPSKYLRAMFTGGYRANKRSENLLRAKNILPPGWQIEPGDDAPLDQYGNLRGGGARMVQILSGLKAFREIGHQMNRTNASMARAAASKRPQAEFFVLYSVKTKTPLGVYTRKGRGQKQVAQILKFTPKRARYAKTLNFKETIDRVFHERFEIHFQEALRRMIAKVKSW
jgi:hypothetical protein